MQSIDGRCSYICFSSFSGNNNVLDLSTSSIIPQRFINEIKCVARALQVLLKLVCNQDERPILRQLSVATFLEQMETVIQVFKYINYIMPFYIV